MIFLSNVTGPPLATPKPVRCGSYSALMTTKGFVVADPMAFGLPELLEETAVLPTGSGFINGHLHLHSRKFPMYYPGSSPKLLLASRHLTVMPFHAVPDTMRDQFKKGLQDLPDMESPDPEMLRNVLPCFEIYQD